MKNTSNTPIDSLNFDDIKLNLKQFLRGQEQFKDYDFEGSSLSIILDLLAYNTHYQAFYANMVAKEAFLDSASIRESVVSLAKHLDYTPRSIKASTIDVNVFFEEEATDSVLREQKFLPRGSTFRAKDETGKTLIYTAINSVKVIRQNETNVAPNVGLKQGILRTTSFIANTQEAPVPKFVLPENNIDIDTISAKVFKSATDNRGGGILWNRSTDITKVDPDTPVFFVQQGRGNSWEVYFGDGIVGKAIENGNFVSFTYLTTDGPLANGVGFNDTETARTMTLINVPGSSNPGISYVEVLRDSNGIPFSSYGGRNPEDIRSIKYYAPRSYQAQERAVTKDDYLAILGREYSDRADSFYVWGGEENDPPQYGKVFISIKPKIGSKLSVQEKTSIEKTILNERNLLTITPEIVDPSVTYITPTAIVSYDESKTTLTPESVANAVTNLVSLFNTEELGKFYKNFKASRLSRLIDGMSPAMISNTISLSLSKQFEVDLTRSGTYSIAFDNQLYHPIDGYSPILSSEMFGHEYLGSTVDCYLEDDGYGNVYIYTFISGQKIIVKKKAGDINYISGLITLVGFAPKYLNEGRTELFVSVKPNSNDILARRNQVLEITETKVFAIPEKSIIDRKASDTTFLS